MYKPQIQDKEEELQELWDCNSKSVQGKVLTSSLVDEYLSNIFLGTGFMVIIVMLLALLMDLE